MVLNTGINPTNKLNVKTKSKLIIIKIGFITNNPSKKLTLDICPKTYAVTKIPGADAISVIAIISPLNIA